MLGFQVPLYFSRGKGYIIKTMDWLYFFILLSVIIFFSVILSIQDIRHKSVSLNLLWLSIIFALLCQIIFLGKKSLIFILTALGTFLLYFITRIITKKKLGMADLFFGIFQGLFLLPKFVPICIWLEVILAFCMNIKSRKKNFAFIPYMAFALIISFILQKFFHI